MLAQINSRRSFAFMAVSHSGILVVAAFNFNAAGLEGSLFLSSIYGLVTVAMLFCAGSIYGRTRTAFIPRLVGAARGNILLTLVFLVSIVMPAALVYLSIINTLDENDWLMMTVFSLADVLMVVFLLRNFQQLFISAPKCRQQLSCIQHSALKECVIAFVVGGLLIVSGFCFTPWLKFVSQDAVAISLMFPMHNVQQHHDK
jgi:NADH-quinone oxidoreductase subunit M